MHVQIHINGITKEKGCMKGSGKLPFSEFQAMDWNFKVSNTCTNLCDNMVEEKSGLRSRIPRKERNEHACIVEGVLGFRIFSARQVFKGGWPD